MMEIGMLCCNYPRSSERDYVKGVESNHSIKNLENIGFYGDDDDCPGEGFFGFPSEEPESISTGKYVLQKITNYLSGNIKNLKKSLLDTGSKDDDNAKRYPKRKLNRINYKEEEIPDDDDYIFCDDCNREWEGQCPVHGPLLPVPDRKVSKNLPNICYAKETIPNMLRIGPSQIRSAGLGVWTLEILQKGLLFGPYEGLKARKTCVKGYSWQIKKDRKVCHYIDASDPNTSNWMRYVNCARHEEEQNLVAFQYKGEIYYRTTHVVLKHVELLVWYGDDYGKELGIDVKAYHEPRRQGNQNKSVTVEPRQGNVLSDITNINPKGPPFPCRDCNHTYNTLHFLQRHIKMAHCTPRDKSSQKENRRDDTRKRDGLTGKTNAPTKREDPLDYPTVTFTIETNGSGSAYMKLHPPEGERGVGVGREEVRSVNTQGCAVLRAYRVRRQVEKREEEKRSINVGEKENKKLECHHCGEAFDLKSELKRHVERHVGCLEAPFDDGSTLKRGECVDSGGDGNVGCDSCGEVFARKSQLVDHLRIHLGESMGGMDGSKVGVERKHVCKECGKGFRRKSILNGHTMIHTGERKFKCDICDKRFIHRHHLTYHIMTHTGERKFKCNTCNKSFITKGDLNVHSRIHTGERKFKCDTCDKSFITKGDLNKHSVVHTRERKFKCDICNKRFIHRVQLTYHMVEHTGERKFKCNICDKSFITKGDLNKHSIVHTRERKFKCDICDKSFGFMSTLNTHMIKHTGGKKHR